MLLFLLSLDQKVQSRIEPRMRSCRGCQGRYASNESSRSDVESFSVFRFPSSEESDAGLVPTGGTDSALGEVRVPHS